MSQPTANRPQLVATFRQALKRKRRHGIYVASLAVGRSTSWQECIRTLDHGKSVLMLFLCTLDHGEFCHPKLQRAKFKQWPGRPVTWAWEAPSCRLVAATSRSQERPSSGHRRKSTPSTTKEIEWPSACCSPHITLRFGWPLKVCFSNQNIWYRLNFDAILVCRLEQG